VEVHRGTLPPPSLCECSVWFRHRTGRFLLISRPEFGLFDDPRGRVTFLDVPCARSWAEQSAQVTPLACQVPVARPLFCARMSPACTIAHHHPTFCGFLLRPLSRPPLSLFSGALPTFLAFLLAPFFLLYLRYSRRTWLCAAQTTLCGVSTGGPSNSATARPYRKVL